MAKEIRILKVRHMGTVGNEIKAQADDYELCASGRTWAEAVTTR